MNTLIKPNIRQNLKNSGYLRHMKPNRGLEVKQSDSSCNSSTADFVQSSTMEKSSPLMRRPIPPAKPPMRLGFLQS